MEPTTRLLVTLFFVVLTFPPFFVFLSFTPFFSFFVLSDMYRWVSGRSRQQKLVVSMGIDIDRNVETLDYLTAGDRFLGTSDIICDGLTGQMISVVDCCHRLISGDVGEDDCSRYPTAWPLVPLLFH